MIGAVRQLNLRRSLQQPLRTIVAVIAIAGGVSLSLGVAVAYASVERSFDDVATFVTGDATLQVRGPLDYAGLDDAVTSRVAAVDGVAAAVPLVTTVVEITDGNGDGRLVAAFGVDCTVEAVFGDIGCDPELLAQAARGDVPLLSERLAAELGSGAVVHTAARAVTLEAVPTSPALDDLNRGRVVVWPLEAAQRLLGREGRLDMVLVVPERGVDPAALRADVERAAGPPNEVGDAGGAGGGSYVTGLLLPGLLLTSLVGLLVGVQLVHTTFGLSFEERRRELAVASAVGAPPRLIAAGMLAEATMLGIVGGVLGTAGAAAVGAVFVDSLSTQIERLSGLRLSLSVPPWIMGVAVMVGITAAVAAAIGPARAAARLDLAAELAERERHQPEPARRRLGLVVAVSAMILGLAFGWLGWRDGTLEPWQPPAALVGIILAAAFAFRLPGLIAADAVQLLGRTAPGRRGTLSVALGNLRGDPRRTASIANALGVAAALTFTLGAIVPGIGATARRDGINSSGDHVLVSVLGTNNAARIESKLTPDGAAALAALPGVERVAGTFFAQIDHPSVGSGSVALVSSTAHDAPTFHVYRGASRAEAFAADRVMIGPALARNRGLRPGDSLALPGVYGSVELTVGGIWASAENVGASVHVSPEQFEALAGERPATFHLVKPDAGTSLTELARRISDAGIDPRLEALDPAAYGDALTEEIETFVDPFAALQRAMLLVAFVATLSTLLLAAVQRRRELATLSAVGMPPADLARMTLAEAGVLGVVATVVGAVSGAVAYVGFVFLSPSATGLPMVWTVPWGVLPVVLPLVVAVALAGAAWPAWRSTRIEPAVALRYE